MKTTLEKEDLELIAQQVADYLKPLISPKKEEDTIFSVRECAYYLRVSTKWCYDHAFELPHFKLGGRLCFRKRDIDRVIDTLSLKEKAKKIQKKEA